MPVGVKYADMTPEQKAQAYDEMMKKREGRKGNSAAKRKAVKQLIEKYPKDYAAFLKAAGGKLPEKK